MSFREQLRSWRKSQGLTIEQAAVRAGVSGRSWWNWEAGHGGPSWAHLQAVLRLVRESGGDIDVQGVT